MKLRHLCGPSAERLVKHKGKSHSRSPPFGLQTPQSSMLFLLLSSLLHPSRDNRSNYNTCIFSLLKPNLIKPYSKPLYPPQVRRCRIQVQQAFLISVLGLIIKKLKCVYFCLFCTAFSLQSRKWQHPQCTHHQATVTQLKPQTLCIFIKT